MLAVLSMIGIEDLADKYLDDRFKYWRCPELKVFDKGPMIKERIYPGNKSGTNILHVILVIKNY